MKKTKPRRKSPVKQVTTIPLVQEGMIEVVGGLLVPAQIAIALTSERWQFAEAWAARVRKEDVPQAELLSNLGHCLAALLQKIEDMRKQHEAFRDELADEVISARVKASVQFKRIEARLHAATAQELEYLLEEAEDTDDED